MIDCVSCDKYLNTVLTIPSIAHTAGVILHSAPPDSLLFCVIFCECISRSVPDKLLPSPLAPLLRTTHRPITAAAATAVSLASSIYAYGPNLALHAEPAVTIYGVKRSFFSFFFCGGHHLFLFFIPVLYKIRVQQQWNFVIYVFPVQQ